MPTDELRLIGAGGHARVVLDALLLRGRSRGSILVSDDDERLCGIEMFGAAVRHPALFAAMRGQSFHVAIGDNQARARLHVAAQTAGGAPVTVIHPSAVVSRRCEIAGGAFVAAGAIVAPGARLGVGAIINHGAVVDHDCVVGDFCHVAPGATLSGGVRLDHYVLVGAGAKVLPGVLVAVGVTVGAGAVVTDDLAAGVVAVGVPARILRPKS